jgi:hypothetical protein
MKKLLYLFCVVLITSCTQEKKNNTQITGTVKGLKKGTLYLEKLKDTVIVVIDSMVIDGENEFLLETYLEEPEVLLLRLNKNSKEDEKIVFFAEAGTTTIQARLKNFSYNAKIKGSKTQDKYAEFKGFMQRFNDENLELIKTNFETLKHNNQDSIKVVETRNNKFLRRKYLYVTNFAVNNKDLEVAPYVTISEIYDANITLLDTINNALTPRIKKSKYGKQLQEFIDAIKED